jgi:hypothetical protein
MKRHLIVGLAAALFLLGMPGSVGAQNMPSQANSPLVLKDQGTFYVDGAIEFRDPNQSDPGSTA